MRTGADRLTAEVDRLQEWVTELGQERDYLWQMLAGAIEPNAKRMEAPSQRRGVLHCLGFRRWPEES